MHQWNRRARTPTGGDGEAETCALLGVLTIRLWKRRWMRCSLWISIFCVILWLVRQIFHCLQNGLVRYFFPHREFRLLVCTASLEHMCLLISEILCGNSLWKSQKIGLVVEGPLRWGSTVSNQSNQSIITFIWHIVCAASNILSLVFLLCGHNTISILFTICTLQFVNYSENLNKLNIKILHLYVWMYKCIN